ncbi:uncharacterized protein E0L32_010494 [Thyridium curvatum]|uniref:Uncharacterized protein n=1 Tax=Thyridium curvatum TaxID=1093900 RepID=A0A507AL52_9PEZI|nr:uncharacterized protein E0L32_010494 [Thyridium curvatum]TPX07807.1 hypothetical protein E0L32_010494 [Thyridium curvatum]
MCRMMVFAGTCTTCGQFFEWADLAQRLSCLEAKNAGLFGQCHRGVQVEELAFDQECDTCAEEDEGIGVEEGAASAATADFGLDGDGGKVAVKEDKPPPAKDDQASAAGASAGSRRKRDNDAARRQSVEVARDSERGKRHKAS